MEIPDSSSVCEVNCFASSHSHVAHGSFDSSLDHGESGHGDPSQLADLMHRQHHSNETCETLVSFVDSMTSVLDAATVDMFAFIDSLDSGRVISFATDSPPTNLLPEPILCVHDIGSLEDASLGSGSVSDAQSAFGSGEDASLGSVNASNGSFL